MTSLRILLISLWVALTGIFAGCNESQQAQTDIIHIEGISWACNVNTSFAIFGSSAEREEQAEVFLHARDGDLLYMLYDDEQLYHRYDPADGNNITVTFDTLDVFRAFVNGRLSYMELTYPTCVEAFKNLSKVEMEQLSFLYLEDDILEDLLPVLEEHENSLQGIGLVLESNDGSARLMDLISIVRPRVLVIDDSWKLPEPEEHVSLAGLELLWIEGNLTALEKLATCCSKLESLIIANWEPKAGELLPLSGLKNLHSLTIAESSLSSLSSIEIPTSLHHLYLPACDTLSDIKDLLKLTNLKSLSLAQCMHVRDLEILNEIEGLYHLSPPPVISQQEFLELIDGQQQLEVLELIGCERIQDISPLKKALDLRILLLQLEYEQLAGLDMLDQLELIVLESEVFDNNPQWIKELKSQLPDSNIVPGSGICLGSGWLMLLLPCIFIFRFLFRRKA
jgi:hypothetical protein